MIAGRCEEERYGRHGEFPAHTLSKTEHQETERFFRPAYQIAVAISITHKDMDSLRCLPDRQDPL